MFSERVDFDEVAHEEDRGVDAAHLNHEDDGVRHEGSGVELAEAVDDRRSDDRTLEHTLAPRFRLVGLLTRRGRAGGETQRSSST